MELLMGKSYLLASFQSINANIPGIMHANALICMGIRIPLTTSSHPMISRKRCKIATMAKKIAAIVVNGFILTL